MKVIKYTGDIWNLSSTERTETVEKVCSILRDTYGVSNLGNPSNPLDDLVYIILANKTAYKTAQATYLAIKSQYTTWEEIIARPLEELQTILHPAGLSIIKSKQIYSALNHIKNDFGRCDLEGLRNLTIEDAETYLIALPGVSEKVAKCVLIYTLDGKVLPVDSHVHRITKRLGWTKRKRADQSHAELEALVPMEFRYTFHVNCIIHGRTICKPKYPVCNCCPISDYCEYIKQDVNLNDLSNT